MREEFIALGGKPSLRYPLYCFLGRNAGFEQRPQNIAYMISLRDVPLDCISFTVVSDSLLALRF